MLAKFILLSIVSPLLNHPIHKHWLAKSDTINFETQPVQKSKNKYLDKHNKTVYVRNLRYKVQSKKIVLVAIGSAIGTRGSAKEVQDTADFDNSRFPDTAWFESLRFDSYAKFLRTNFNRPAIFESSTFQNDVGFVEAKFDDSASFQYANFQEVSFARANFSGSGNFSYVHFNQRVDFSNMRLYENTFFDFSHSVLPDFFDFSNNPIIYNEVSLVTADLDTIANLGRQYHYVNLFNSDISKIKVDYLHFRLYFHSDRLDKLNQFFNFSQGNDFVFKGKKCKMDDREVYEQLRNDKDVREYLNQVFPNNIPSDTIVKSFFMHYIKARYFPKRLSNDDIMSTYEKLRKNFDISGQKLSYEAIDIEYQNFKNGWFILPHIWNCYGYHKEWIFYWTAGFILIFSVFTYLFLDKLNRPPESGGAYYVANIPSTVDLQTSGSLITRYKHFSRKLWYSIVYTATIFFVISLKIDNINFKRFAVIYIILIYLIGLLCIGYAANFVVDK